ncbi:MAG: nuclear transport factor 2 family protein [Acidobacteria bacterium]|nr:nuclear transport factor 2 family protein [Acidobacteriota bacterium]
MLQKLLSSAAIMLALTHAGFAQNTPSSAARATGGIKPKTSPARTTTAQTAAPAATTPQQQQDSTAPPGPPATSTRTRRATAVQTRARAAEAAATRALRAAFDTLIDGIRKADAGAVMGVYWNSPQLILFNNNGTVTKAWTQVRSNRESLYMKVRDVKLDVRDVNVRVLGSGAGVVSCLWEQSQSHDGQPERATGRLTLVFQKVGTEWKAVHAHTSPDRPDPSRLMPSERTNDAPAETKPPAKP